MNIEVNETVARMLATENLSIRYSASADTANFDVLRRLLTLPIYAKLRQAVYMLLAAHESFHALWTKETRSNAAKRIDPTNPNRAAGYVNICEDVRIENLGKERYPGIRAIFREGYAALLENKFFGDLSNIHQMSLIDRVNIHFKCGGLIHVPFADVERPYINAVNAARSYDEMIAACKALYDFAKETQNQQFPELQPPPDQKSKQSKSDPDDQQSGQQQKSSKSSKDQTGDDPDETKGSDAEGDEQNDSSNAAGDGDQSEDGDEDGKSQESSDESGDDQDGDGSGDSSEDGADAGKANSGDVEDQSETDSTPGKFAGRPLDATSQDTFDKNLQSHIEPKNHISYVTLPTVKMRAAVVDYKTIMAEFEAACASAQTTKTYDPNPELIARIWKQLEPDVMCMAQEFLRRRRALQHARTRTAQTGDLDMNKLWAHRVDDNIFATTQLVPDDTNHGLVMVVDWSGSMAGPLFHVLLQLLSVMMFCRRVKIPFDAYVFLTRASRDGDSFITSKETVRLEQTTRLYNLFSSRMPTNHFYKMCLMMFSSFTNNFTFNPPLGYLNPNLYSTPLAEAMLIASEVLPEFRRRNKLQYAHTIVLTDGDGNSSLTTMADQLEDPITRRTYAPVNGEEKIEVLHLLPRVVRDRTKSKMIGMFVGGPTPRMLRFAKMEEKAANAAIAKDGYLSLPGTHYDAFFVIDPAMSVPSDLNPDQAIFMRGKSRIMLRKFIEMIA